VYAIGCEEEQLSYNLTDTIGRIKENLRAPIGLSLKAMQILECEKINSIYVKFVHDGICSTTMNALVWTFVSLILISFFAMILITLRASWSAVRYYDGRLPLDIEIGEIEIPTDSMLYSFSDNQSTQPQNILSVNTSKSKLEGRLKHNTSSKSENDSP